MEKHNFCYNVYSCIDVLCKNDARASKDLSRFLSKQIWAPDDRQLVLETLANLFIQVKVSRFGEVIRPILLDITTRCATQIEKLGTPFEQHVLFCLAIADCLKWPDIQKFTLGYIQGKTSFLSVGERTSKEPKKKKLRKCQSQNKSKCRAAWLFVKYLGESVEEFLPLIDILPFVQCEHLETKWYACHAVMTRQRMSAAQRMAYMELHFTDKETRELRLSLGEDMIDHSQESKHATFVPEHTNELSHTRHMILGSDFCDKVTCVGGVLLSRIPVSQSDMKLDLLPVPSNETNLHSIAMAVSSGSPVLLQGVVGSGKTTLVEHLGKLTGRVSPPALMKIQLGDQMDSKALLGTYRCTEVPGEFIWQPGVLTQAVTNGYWVLMEDIDYAPMEVVSVLMPLLETRTLSIPGHGDCIRAAPGFHLFATQRLVGGSSGWQKQQTGTSQLLDKLWTSVLVEPLSRSELKLVICTKFPKMETVVDRLLDIYFLLSAGNHQGALDDAMAMQEESVGKFLTRDGRLISTRDLITWCSRIAKDFDVSSTATGNLVLQEAMDCFVACLSKPSKRLPLAEAIGAKLNVPSVKVQYYMDRYKPEVTVTTSMFTVGRVSLPVQQTSPFMQMRTRSTFSYTRQSSVLLERVAMCVLNREPVLLVGETGTGKTSSVQFLAEQLGHKLHVINMNQQSDSADLLGGFKPVDVRHVIKPLYEEFELLFCKSFSRKQNAKFLGHLQDCFNKKKWDTLFQLIDHSSKSALTKFENEANILEKWAALYKRLGQLKLQVQQTENALAFTFVEGSLVKAIRAGDWVLLDEINLAAMETLECLSGLLESTAGSILLMERGDLEPVVRHPNFRLFACMNPATDVGKKDLSPGIRNRFTELYVDELEDSQDLKILVCDYLRGLSLTAGQVDGIVKFYLTIRGEASRRLTDGTGHPPHYSLRTLCRALKFAAKNSCDSIPRSLYEGFCLSFLTQLDRSSHPVVEQLVSQHVLGKANVKAVLKQALPAPTRGRCLNFEGYWVGVGDLEPFTPQDYILTPSVRANLRDLVRVVSSGQHPVLLQGETSVGKTSLIHWLAQSSGNTCVRVNNHEHTDLQEYVGCYAADDSGKLAFKEGVLVEAMKLGHWIILDELNLAPSDVLEALNRLLDDNRELFIPETQETVKAHSRFMLFATQNPPGHYGGRKMLSRAFRNRFVELHFDAIPNKELETILHERSEIPLSYARRLVGVMLELQTRRRGSGVFAGKTGFMTLRDLFRWAQRYKCPELDDRKFYNWDKHLADQGYMLLAGRVRKPEEAEVIKEVIEKHFKCKLSTESLFTLNQSTSLTSKSTLESVLDQSAEGFHHIVWTSSMRRLAVLIGQAIRYKEPVLLVGETGCGKTTMCQLYAAIYKSRLHSVNCHLHTESADFLGGLRPVRSHDDEHKDKLFEWVDGPLVQAMKGGAMFLVDEISLADDSVLERLNSVLEPERTILLAEKGGGDGATNQVEQVVAKDGFQVFATMNPGGDFGKKELSPALRNRFTEIWCPPSNQRQDLVDIIEHNLHSGIHLGNQEDGTSGIGRAVMDFVEWFSNNELGRRCTVSIRDILTWVQFINTCSRKVSSADAMETDDVTLNQLDPAVAYIHGACLVFLDGLGAGTTSQGKDVVVGQLRAASLSFLIRQVNSLTRQEYDLDDLGLLDDSHMTKQAVMETVEDFCIPPFSVAKGDKKSHDNARYALEAPGTCRNAQRVLRALQLPRPLLLEGSPGVGKTSLVTAIARASGRDLVRINLSEQTDVTDLFGADLPVEGAEGGRFAWRDGPLLKALKAGSWVVLDELNLASQSVLEGLNACLDHRAEVYIPELGKTFHIQHEKTRLFACQNPLNQGGGRKGLPRSFLNRFTQVYIEPLTVADLMFIASTMYTDIPQEVLQNMVHFIRKMYEETGAQGSWGQKGGPWEFNLRDLFRWCDLLRQNQRPENLDPGEYLGLVFADRMRTPADKQKVYNLYMSVFEDLKEPYQCSGVFHFDPDSVQVGHSFLEVKDQGHHHDSKASSLQLLNHSLGPLESLLKCVEMNWMAILVGSPSSGKSSTVELLARLTGNQLNVLAMNSAMDTTELLGGFEQADESRHIEEILDAVKGMVTDICNKQLLLGNQDSLATLTKVHELWKQCLNKPRTAGTLSSVDELHQKRTQVSDILTILNMCKKIARNFLENSGMLSQISAIKKRLIKLKGKLSLAVAGQGGGAFEWVDSVLVKSLVQGQWLMIDNVNFCSASVLDRLNALLEPHGVLSINERGVIDGEIPTIKPHPNFRLFLCMDPRHGEISRAMRNRGIEIYLPGEEDGHSYETFDLKLIANGMGLHSQVFFDWLMELHNLLKEELPRGEKPGVSSFLQACAQVTHHRDHGYDLDGSLRLACYCVYVQRQRHTQTKKIATDILEGHLKEWNSISANARNPELGLVPICLPDAATVISDPSAAMVIRNTAMFVHVVETYKSIEHQDIKLKASVNLALSLASEGNLLLTMDWLQNFCQKKELDQSDVYKYVVTSLQNIGQQMVTFKVKDKLEKVMGSRSRPDFTLDLQWNLQLLESLLFASMFEDISLVRRKLVTLFNRLHCQQRIQVDLCLLQKHVDRMQAALQKDRSLARQTTHEAVSHLVTLFPLVVMAITDDIPNMELTSYSEAAKMLESFCWWFRLYQIAGSSLHSDNLGSQLSLYWKWAQKHFLGSLVQSNSEQKQMKAAIGTLQSILSKDNKKWKTFVKFRRSLGHPRPFKGQGQATMHAEAGELFRVLELASKPSDLQNDLKIQVNIHYREFLIDAAEKLLSLEVVNDEGQVAMDEIQASLRNLLIKHKLLSKYGNNVAMETDDHMTSEVDRSDCTKYGAENPLAFNQLWPIFEHITSTEGFQLFEKFVLGNLDGWHGDSYHGYVRLFTPWKPGAVVTFKSVSQSLLKDLVPNIQTTLLEGLRKGHCVRNSTLWAQWSGKLAEDNEEVPETKQFTLHQPVLSLVLCMLLSRSDTEVSMTIPPNVKISAPLKSYTRELTQLWFMSQHIWAHVGRISGSDLLSMERRSLLAVFIQSLKALKPVMSKDCPDDLYSDLLDSVATGDDLTPDLLKKLDYTLHAYCTLEHIQKDTSDLLDAAIDSIAKVIGANSDDIGDAVCSEGGFGNLGCLGCAWVDTGLFNMNLLAPQGPVDPVEKVLIKLNIAQNELTEQEAELAVLCSHHRLVTGQDLLQQADRLVHPRVTYLKTRSVELRKQIAELEKQIAFRPAPSQYDMLVMDVRNFLASVGSTENVHGLVTKLRACIGTRSRDACSVSRQYDLWEQSVDKFVQSLSVVYPVYRDITQPLIAAVQQVVHGMGLLSQEVKRSKEVAKVTGSFGHEAGEISQKLEKIVILAGKFPTLSTINPSCLHLATNLTSLDNLDLVRDVVQRSQPENTSADEVLVTLTDSILSGGLYCVVLEAQARGALTPDLLMTLTHILDMYVSSWKHEEAARKVKEAEEASLYRYKTETHGDERSEEEQLEADFLQNFPSFNEDFIDLVEATSMEDSHARKETDQSKTSSTEASSLHLTSSQMTLISGVHEKLYKGLVSTDWYRPVVMATVQLSDWLRPLLSTYTAATILTTRLVDIMSNQVDGHLQGGHLVVAAVQQCYVLQASQQLSSPLVPSPGVYDMYHDPNVPEVIQLVDVLRTVRARVMELQGEWPDHPTLKKLHEIMDRIEEQPITDPVMKFLTGIELLLKTAQDWESNASQHVSMATQLAEISRLIMQWRKLELSCWMNAMDTEVYKFRTEASKWWFHLYQLSQDTLTQQGENCPSLDEFTKALKQFIEKSSLGDFHTRLEMLLSFHCNMVAMATREAKGQVESMETDAIKKAEIGNEGGNIDLNLAADNKTESMVDKDDEVAMATRKRLATMQQVLWNLYKFYGRFSSTVQAELDRLRQPIEKELKGFVKIARWSDINFWALKQTAEKTHRTLHKHIKQFQGVLKLPVQGILGDVESGATTLPAVSGAEYSSWTEGLLSYQSVLLQKLRAFKAPDVTVMNPTLATAAEQLPLQFKLGQLCSRLNKHWITVVMRSRYCERIAVVDQFTGELIEEIHALQALEINRSVEKDKQKSEAKHINLRKRKALSDLFKYLAKLGLSYRKGLTSCDKNEDGALQATPVDLDVSLSGDAAVHQAWDSCEDYFYRCVSRRAQLWSALMTPSRELGTGNIERCKGFAEHLYALLIEQQTSVACLTQQYTGIRTTLADISRLSENGGKKIHQSETCSWMESCRTLLSQFQQGLSQFQALLHCCPRRPLSTTPHPSPLPVHALHQMALVRQGTEGLADVLDNVQTLIHEVHQAKHYVPNNSRTTVFVNSDVNNIHAVFTKLASMKSRLLEIIKLFTDPGSESPNAFTEVLHLLVEEASVKLSEFNTWQERMGSRNDDGEPSKETLGWFSSRLEEIIASVLLVVQKQSKSTVSMETGSDDVAKDENEEDTDIEEGHLVKLVHEQLKQATNCLQAEQIHHSLLNLLKRILSEPSSAITSAMLDSLRRAMPLLTQYQGIMHHHLVGNIATQRTMGKLLSVLLGVFTDLATKGFCIPPELSDEMAGEGATEFCDMEEAGLGEGEGVKNVSDQIENEDQLDEAKRPEDHKKEDPSNQPDVKSEENAIEMTDDIDAKVQDLEDVDKQDDDDENNEGDEEEIDKQLGDLGDQDAEKLDEQMWGSDQEEEEEHSEEKKEETGPGDGKQSESELVAKDDNVNKSGADNTDDKHQTDEQEEEEEEKERKPHNLDMNQVDYDDDQVDPYHGKQEEQQAPDDLDLPDDLNLDDAEDQEGKEEESAVDDGTGKDEEETQPQPAEGPEDNVEQERREETPGDQEQKQDEDRPEGEEADNPTDEQTDTDPNRNEEEGKEEPGFTPQDKPIITDENQDADEQEEPDNTDKAVEHYGKTSHDSSDNVEQSKTAQDAAGEKSDMDNQETTGQGQASTDTSEGHQGHMSQRSQDTGSEGKRKKTERQPGKADSNRSLGTDEQKYKRLKTTGSTQTEDKKHDQEQDTNADQRADMFEHVKDSDSHHDGQTLDTATAEQQREQGQITQEQEEAESDVDEDLEMQKEESEDIDEKLDTISSTKLKSKQKHDEGNTDASEDEGDMEIQNDHRHEIPGEVVSTSTVVRGMESTIHTAMEFLSFDTDTYDLESLRLQLETELGSWSQSNLPVNTDLETAASELWHRYEALTASLAQDLCEQLRLVLEPSQATKLKGDYRTGKRLNMRKVIPYIASQFRKDKIWLRRTKPSKRQYQIMLAVDDSSSMVDNHSKQMAFESLSLVSNALTLLEAGQLSICSFGEEVRVLHPFSEQFTSQSGAHLLQYLTFEQKKTKIAQFLKHATREMLDARQKQQGSMGNPDTSQLLLIVSDGRGLFMEGMEVVKTAVRNAREANIFIVFVIIDNPINKDSILDIKVPVFKESGQIPEIKSYMDSFPFPFYIILRDINSLPLVLSDALRQWFELVTAVDR